MNRTTAILLALGILLAHSLSIHRDYQWRFAGPFDQAHVAYALGTQVAESEGLSLAPESGGPGLQAYPSPLWVGLAAVASWFEWPIPRFAQMFGILSALLLLSISTRIAYDRVAGVIPPLLLVLSGTMASGAVCGTEHMALALFVVLAFVCFERNHPRWLMIALALIVATRAEGLLLFGVWLLFWGIDRFKGKNKPAASRLGLFARCTDRDCVLHLHTTRRRTPPVHWGPALRLELSRMGSGLAPLP